MTERFRVTVREIVMCTHTPAVSTCRCFNPLLHRESYLLSDYCLLCIVFYSGQMPRATEHNTGHNRQTQRGAGSWQKEGTLTHVHTYGKQTQLWYICSYTLANPHTVHIHTFVGMNTHSQLLKGTKLA